MNSQDIRAFAHEFRRILEKDGAGALEHYDWASRFFDLEFEMDCGESLENSYGLKLGDSEGFALNRSRINNTRILGNAIFSQCRYLTHWSGGYGDEDAIWLVAALERLEELTYTQ